MDFLTDGALMKKEKDSHNALRNQIDAREIEKAAKIRMRNGVVSTIDGRAFSVVGNSNAMVQSWAKGTKKKVVNPQSSV